MLGLQIAANRVRPNRKKKGSMVGWDPAKGRFSTYARGEADRLMREAAAGHRYRGPSIPPRQDHGIQGMGKNTHSL